MSNTTRFLEERFPDDYAEPLVSLIQRAYRANADCHDPFLGHDEMSYGLLLYKSIKRFISNLSEKEEWLEVTKHAPQFVFKIAGFRMSTYRSGDPFDVVPEESFPKNRKGAWFLASHNKLQRSFNEIWGEGTDTWTDDNLPTVILAHSGSFEAGLSQVFLGVPEDFDENNTIIKWEACKVLWKKGDGTDFLDIPVSPNGNMPPQAPIETVLPPMLSLNKIKKAKGEK